MVVERGEYSGATRAELQWASVTESAAGWYSVRITDATGSVSPAPARLAVTPTIVGQPADQQVARGQSALFAVGAEGAAPLTYQWYHNSRILLGQTRPTLQVSNVQPADAGSYTVRVGHLTPLGMEYQLSRAAILSVP